MSRVSTRELYFIGFIGTPYYIFAIVLASVLSEHLTFGFLIILPLWFFYDRPSQSSYITNVRDGSCSKTKYALISIIYQLIFIGVVSIVIGAFET